MQGKTLLRDTRVRIAIPQQLCDSTMYYVVRLVRVFERNESNQSSNRSLILVRVEP